MMATPESPDVGLLRQRVELQIDLDLVANSVGQHKPNWGAVGTYWARVEPLAGRELVNAMQIKNTVSHRITMRAIGPILPGTHRLIYGGTRIFNLESVTRVEERNAYLSILATELKGKTP